MTKWRPVVGYEGLYEVSDGGVVRSIARVIQRGNGHRQFVHQRVLSHYLGRGYLHVSLNRSGESRTEAIHRLVAAAFLGPRPDGMEVCHNDGNRTNNAATNLRYDTHANNINDAVAHGNHPQASKTHCPQGHEYTEENTLWWKKNGGEGRVCRECQRIRSAKKNAKVAARKRASAHLNGADQRTITDKPKETS